MTRAPYLSPAEQTALALAAKDGDKAALDRLMVAFLPMAYLIAWRYPKVIDPDDGAQIAIMVMGQACRTFDPEAGDFLPWLWWWMAQALARARGYERAELGVPADGAWRGNYKDCQPHLRLDGPVRRRIERATADQTESPEDQAAANELAAMVRAAALPLAKRRPLWAAVIERRLLAEDPETLQEIGDGFGCCREHVRKAEAQILAVLKAKLSGEDEPEDDDGQAEFFSMAAVA
jgi:RNA polymerase sigma factor (sigma-70 family)